MTGFLLRIRNLGEEVVRIGPLAAVYRAWRELLRRTDIDLLLRPVRQPVSGELTEAEHAMTGRSPTCPFFLEGLEDVRSFLRNRLSDHVQNSVVLKGREASKGRIRAFRAWPADFGHPPRWLLNPLTGKEWPEGHSRRVLTGSNRLEFGDIKVTWEIGRFLHIPDVLRAFALTDDVALIERLFEQLASFDELNPVNFGPHWISEQEVAIRGCMLTLLLFAVRGEVTLTDRQEKLLHRQIRASAEYCEGEIRLARYAIDNNHLIAAATAMYVVGSVLPGGDSERWIRMGRSLILGALDRQWHADGAYIQPSHNYHRLALDYLLWVLRLAALRGDLPLVTALRQRIRSSFRFLNSMTMASGGRLPNWGPNDGALFAPFTSSEFRDYRPLLTSLRYASDGVRQYDAGPWDEQLVWLWGSEAAFAAVDPVAAEEASFPEGGLHTLRQAASKSLLVFRCGPILSRYGQQADQLHVDLTWQAENVLRDTGSYSYADPRYHEWFRATRAHNTVVVGGKSQMLPHRQFLFLRWPNSRLLELPPAPAGVRAWYGGVHDGYHRIPQRVTHSRVVAELENGNWMIVDRLIAARTSAGSVEVDIRWHLAAADYALCVEGLDYIGLSERFGLRWAATSALQPSVAQGNEIPVDGWISDCYGMKKEALAVNVNAELQGQLVVGTLIGAGPGLDNSRLKVDTGMVSARGVRIPVSSMFRA